MRHFLTLEINKLYLRLSVSEGIMLSCRSLYVCGLRASVWWSQGSSVWLWKERWSRRSITSAWSECSARKRCGGGSSMCPGVVSTMAFISWYVRFIVIDLNEVQPCSDASRKRAMLDVLGCLPVVSRWHLFQLTSHHWQHIALNLSMLPAHSSLIRRLRSKVKGAWSEAKEWVARKNVKSDL